MRQAYTDGSMCIRCARAAACTIPVDAGEPVLACARFEGMDSSSPASASATRIVYEIAPSRVEGLCGDCENRESCVFRRREGGTWHCEEYA